WPKVRTTVEVTEGRAFGLAAEPFAVPFFAAEVSAPLAHRTAPVGDQVTIFESTLGRDLEYRGVRPALRVSHAFVIEVRGEHHNHFQPVQFLRTGERVLEPTPALFTVQLLDALAGARLEAGFGETAVGFEIFFRAGQIAEVFDSADRDEIVRLDE